VLGKGVHKMEEYEYKISQLDSLIKLKSRIIKFYLFWTILQILSGIVLFFAVEEISGDYLKTSLKIVGGILASMSAFPVKEVFSNKGALLILKSLKLQFRNFNSFRKYEKDKINNLFWEILKKFAIG
jgi:hypothetical protein